MKITFAPKSPVAPESLAVAIFEDRTLGGAARDIDKALKLGLNHPMGPFELVDLVGLDTRLSILKYLQSVLGDKYRPCPLIETYVRAGRLGKKVGRGVYDYD